MGVFIKPLRSKITILRLLLQHFVILKLQTTKTLFNIKPR